MRKSVWLVSAGLFALATPALAQQTDTDQGAAQPTDGATAEAGDVDASTNTAAQDNQQTGEIITWIYRKVWNSYPYEFPRVTFEEIVIDRDLWYTGGIEGFISAMEASALMGKNVARLIVDRFAEKLARSGHSPLPTAKTDSFSVPKADL